ncbi:MAG: hypothetical protein ACK4M7_06035 [Burkholderiales bacterium]
MQATLSFSKQEQCFSQSRKDFLTKRDLTQVNKSLVRNEGKEHSSVTSGEMAKTPYFRITSNAHENLHDRREKIAQSESDTITPSFGEEKNSLASYNPYHKSNRERKPEIKMQSWVNFVSQIRQQIANKLRFSTTNSVALDTKQPDFISELPQELKNIILEGVSFRDLVALTLTNLSLKDAVDAYLGFQLDLSKIKAYKEPIIKFSKKFFSSKRKDNCSDIDLLLVILYKVYLLENRNRFLSHAFLQVKEQQSRFAQYIKSPPLPQIGIINEMAFDYWLQENISHEFGAGLNKKVNPFEIKLSIKVFKQLLDSESFLSNLNGQGRGYSSHSLYQLCKLLSSEGFDSEDLANFLKQHNNEHARGFFECSQSDREKALQLQKKRIMEKKQAKPDNIDADDELPTC